MRGAVVPRETAKKARLRDASDKAQRVASARTRAWKVHRASLMQYLPDIRRLLTREESEFSPMSDYMTLRHQPSLNAGMRATLVDWLVHVHWRAKLRSETLFLTVALVDRFLEKRKVSRQSLQLVGIAALFIATKFVDGDALDIYHLVVATDLTYTRRQILTAEAVILTSIQFRIWRTTQFDFLKWFQLTMGCSQIHFDIAHFLLELALVDYGMIKYVPSHLAASAVLLSSKLLRRQPWFAPGESKTLRETGELLRPCAKDMCSLVERRGEARFKAVLEKFSETKTQVIDKLNRLHSTANAAISAKRANASSKASKPSTNMLPSSERMAAKENLPPKHCTPIRPPHVVSKSKTPLKPAGVPSLRSRALLHPRMRVRKHILKNSSLLSPKIEGVYEASQRPRTSLSCLQAALWVRACSSMRAEPPVTIAPGLAVAPA